MQYISSHIAEAVAGSAREVAAALSAQPGAGLLAAPFVNSMVAFAMSQAGDPEAENLPEVPEAEMPALTSGILRIVAEWSSGRWEEVAAWELVLTAFQMEPAPCSRDQAA